MSHNRTHHPQTYWIEPGLSPRMRRGVKQFLAITGPKQRVTISYANRHFFRREFAVTQLAHATESQITPIEKIIHTAKAHTTSAKGGPYMTKLACSATIRCLTISCLFFGMVTLAPSSWAQQRAPILEKIAKAYGIESWDQIQAIRYTWNGEITGLFKAAHKWEWEPKTNKVSYEGTDKAGKPVKVTYVRTDPSSQSDAVKNQV